VLLQRALLRFGLVDLLLEVQELLSSESIHLVHDSAANHLSVERGRLGVGHRPRLRGVPMLAQSGVTDVLTLLTPTEGAGDIGRAVAAAGLRWHALPLPNGQPPPKARDAEIAACLLAMRARLHEGATIFVHCSAGIHRTGMMSAALLGLCGWDPARVLAGLHQMRGVTGHGVGAERLAWAAKFAARHRGGE
jgi:hypothetical protein